MTKAPFWLFVRNAAAALAALTFIAGLQLEADSSPLHDGGSEKPKGQLQDKSAAIGQIVSEVVGDAGGYEAVDARPRGESEDHASARSEIYRSLDPDDHPESSGSVAEEQFLQLSETGDFAMEEVLQVSLGDVVAASNLRTPMDDPGAALFETASSAANAVGNNKELTISVTAPSIGNPVGD